MDQTLSSLVVLSLSFSLAACAPLVVEPDEISGTLVDGHGTPVVGALVKVDDAIVTTDAAGHFELESGPGPYDLTAFLPLSIDPFSAGPAIFLGLVDHSPTIRLVEEVMPSPRADLRDATV